MGGQQDPNAAWMSLNTAAYYPQQYMYAMGGYPMQMQQPQETHDQSTLAQLNHLLTKFKELHKNSQNASVAGFLSYSEAYLRGNDVNNAAQCLSVGSGLIRQS